jgi:hypothetical protein
MSFAIPVPGPPCVVHQVGMLPGPQSVMPVGQPLVPAQQPCMALIQQLTQPMIPATVPQVMPPGYATMQQPAPGSYWPVQSAFPPAHAPVPMSGGVSGFQNPSASSQPSVSAQPRRTYNVSPATSPLQSMPTGATGRQVRLEDDGESPDVTSGRTSVPAIVTNGQGEPKVNSSVMKTLADG